MPKRLSRIEAVPIPGKGRGVQAVEAIAPGELLELATTILLSSAECDRIEGTTMGDYYFAHPANTEEGLVVLGLASLCNHAEDPNAEVRWEEAPGLGWIAKLVSLRAIAPGEEVTRRYRCPPWFPVAP